MTTVKPGQIWQDCDKRGYGRHIRVEAIEDARPAPDRHSRDVPARAVVVECGIDGRIHGSRPRRTRIRLDRFKPTSNGYRLITDVEDA